MKIQPNQQTSLTLSDGEQQWEARLLHIKDHTLTLLCQHWSGKGQTIRFQSSFFYGEGTVSAVQGKGSQLELQLLIQTIHFRPGIVIDEIL
ncbi:MAG: hypothetical protein JJT82_01295 [Legionellaceae bacterium]|nr:hypothetical protein [Legionellaceae bacterium]